MYKRLTVATTIMFLMFGVLFAGASQDAKPTDAEKEAYYKALEVEKEGLLQRFECENRCRERSLLRSIRG